MGSVLSIIYQNPEQANLEDEIAESDEFHDAVGDGNATDKMDQEYLVTDAVESKFAHIFVNTSKITYETVADIESELEYYEKVALVFLLYDQPDNALQSLLIEHANMNSGTTTNLIANWAKSKHLSTSSWQDRFIEALCVIQNYAILRRFGYNKEEMKDRFLPTNSYGYLHLDKIMKALYVLCEQIPVEKFNILISYLAADFREKGLNFQDFGMDYLEVYLLHCFSMKYIKKDNLSNLIAILKKIGMSQEADRLESVVNRDTGDSQESKTYKHNAVQKTNEHNDNDMVNKNNCNFDLTQPTENYANKTQPSCSQNSVIGDNSIVKNMPSTDCYKIDPDHVGICLIINQREFYKDHDWKNNKDLTFEEKTEYIVAENRQDLEKRLGTDVDKASLMKIFKKLGFRIVIRENLNHREMIPNIKEVMGNFTNKDSCFVVCILSHGVANQIYASNTIPVDINNIKDGLHDRNYTALLGKPKILIIQSCQGTETQKVIRSTSDGNVTDGPSHISNSELNSINDPTGVPEKRDLILCMSTVTGFASVRNKNEGTWYIQELCDIIDEKCDSDHFQDILTMVTDKVSNKRWDRNKDSKGIVTMVPEFSTTLSKKLYLRKIIQPSE